MMTSMLGRQKRGALVARWPEVMVRGVLDEGGEALFPKAAVPPAQSRLGPRAESDTWESEPAGPRPERRALSQAARRNGRLGA